MPRVALLLALLSLAGFSGCSLTTFDRSACESSESCAELFGVGSTCRSDGYCSDAAECSADDECALLGGGAQCTFGRCGPALACEEDDFCADEVGLGATCEAGRCASTLACDDTLACRTSFGWGAVCTSGRCERRDIVERCSFFTQPEGLFRQAERYADHEAIGLLINFQENTVERRAAEAVVRLLNERGGTADRPLALIACDHNPGTGTEGEPGTTTAQAAAATADFLADIGVPVIVGALNSNATEAAYRAARDRETLFITPAAGTPGLRDLAEAAPAGEEPGLLWRTVPTDDRQVEVLVAEILRENLNNISIVYQFGAYGDGFRALLSDRLRAEGRSFRELSFGSSQSRYDQDLENAIESAADGGNASALVFISADTVDYVNLLDQIADSASHADLRILLTDVAYKRNFLMQLDDDPALLARIRGTRAAPDADAPVFADFRTQFRAFFPDASDPADTAYAATTHDAIWLAALGYSHTLSRDLPPTGREISRGIALATSGVGDPVPLRASRWNDLQGRARDGEAFQVTGAYGPLRFDARQDLADGEGAVELWGLAPPGAAGCPADEPLPACFFSVTTDSGN